jgi:glycosyltransferase involved in cell wall biosynthesis
MRILHVIASVNPEGGGPIEAIISQGKIWVKMGHQREIASLDLPDDPWVKSCQVVTYPLGFRSPAFRQLRRWVPWLSNKYSPNFVPWLKQNASRYDALVVNGLWNYGSLGARLARLAPRSVPYVVFPHGMLDPWFKGAYPIKHVVKQLLWWASEGALLRDAGAVIFTSDEERALARKAFVPYNVREAVVGNGVPDISGDPNEQISAFRQRTPWISDRRFLLFLSRIHPKKGCDLLIHAFSKIAKQHPQLDLVMAGPDQVGWKQELQEMAVKTGAANRIHWPGMLTGNAKWGAFRSCEAFILPSHQENFGMVVAEATASAKPVLITNKINIWRKIEKSGAGFVFPDTLDGVSWGINQFIQLSQDASHDMGRNARICFLNHFSVEQAAKNLLDVIERIKMERL